MTEPAVQAAGLRFEWQPGTPLIDLPQLRVAMGDKLFVAGASGSGKSTLLGLLGGVLQPTAGELKVIGKPLHNLSARKRDKFRADHVGFIFQMFNLVPYLSVMENVLLPLHFSRRRRQQAGRQPAERLREAERLLDALELSDKQLQARNPGGLSIGQQQRVAAARALIGGPELLIADEPTSALDEGTREKFLELLFKECERQSTTLVLVSHDSRLAGLFDRRISLVDEVTGEGS